MTIPTHQLSVFLSYAREDKIWAKKLKTHLSSLKRQGIISTLYDREVVPSTNRAEAIDKQLTQASIILLLVSANFLASDDCYNVEMTRALERHKAGEVRVIPIIIRPTDWTKTPFAHFSPLPKEGKPITTWNNKDEAFVDVVDGINRAIEYHQSLNPTKQSPPIPIDTNKKLIPLTPNRPLRAIPPRFLSTKAAILRKYKKVLSMFILLTISFILFLGYHPSSLQQNIPPTINSVTQEDNSIHVTWDIMRFYDKYNILISEGAIGEKLIWSHIFDQRSGEVWLDQITPNIRYTFLVEGCVEERLFQLILHSSCTSWSNGVALETIYSPIQQTYTFLGGKQWDRPISPEIRDGNGWYHQDYSKGGSIYWSKNTGTLTIYGSIAQAWYKLGRGSSSIGYPLSQEHNWPNHPHGRVACFQHGIISWFPEEGDHVSVGIGEPCV